MRAHGLTAAAGLLAAGAGLSVMAAFLVGQTPTTPPSDATLAISAEAATPLLSLPDAPRVLIFGGSYTYGIGASAPEQGFAYKLAENEGWDAVIDGVPGTGYLDPGPHRTGAYPARMAELDADETFDLIIIQGSTHDFAMDHSRLPAAVTATLAAANKNFPGTPIVMLGPVTYGGSPERISVNSQLARAAAANDTIYLSPVDGDWYTAGDRATLRDEATGKPNDTGHQALAERLGRSVTALTS